MYACIKYFVYVCNVCLVLWWSTHAYKIRVFVPVHIHGHQVSSSVTLHCLALRQSLTQLEASYFFLTYWVVSFCKPLVPAQRCWNHIYARSCLTLLLLFLCECGALNFGLHSCIQPVKIHLVSLETNVLFPENL